MRIRFDKINVSHIPKGNRHFSKECVGMFLHYELGNHIGDAEILDVIESSSYPIISLLIDSKEHLVAQNNINAYLTKLFYGASFSYSKGDIVNGLVVLDINGKVVTVRCEKDGHEFYALLNDLKKGSGCPVCNKRLIVKGINDFATTHPNLMKYLKNQEDGYKNFYGSAKKTIVKCPVCGTEKEMSFNALTEKGFSCPSCSDGLSFGEKYVFSMLSQLKLNFETQKTFDWSFQKRYDFYLPNENMIIEVHGLQHYEPPMGNWTGISLEQQQANDLEKKTLAETNGIDTYIEIDARRSDGTYIKENLINNLENIFDLSKVDWNKCLESTMTSLIKITCDLWNSGLDVKHIADEIKISTSGVRKYLKQGNKVGWCDYEPKQGQHLHKHLA